MKSLPLLGIVGGALALTGALLLAIAEPGLNHSPAEVSEIVEQAETARLQLYGTAFTAWSRELRDGQYGNEHEAHEKLAEKLAAARKEADAPINEFLQGDRREAWDPEESAARGNDVGAAYESLHAD